MLRLLKFRCSFCSSPLDETQHDGAFHDQPQLLVGPRLGGGRAARVQLRHLGLGEVARTRPLLVLVAHHRPGQALERLDRGEGLRDPGDLAGAGAGGVHHRHRGHERPVNPLVALDNVVGEEAAGPQLGMRMVIVPAQVSSLRSR